MANWSDLKNAVMSVIKTNGNQEITGKVLQDVLNNIISNVGLNSSFAGVATPETNPGTPDGNVFYLAATAGTYSNFHGIEINPGEAVILEWKGSWVKKDSGFATNEKLSQLGSKYNELNSNVISISRSLKHNKNKDALYVCDSEGNVILLLDKNGLDTILSASLVERLSGLTQSNLPILTERNDALYVCDRNGNVVLALDSDGFNSILSNGFFSQLSQKTSWLYDKTFVALGASLTTSGKWQKSLADITGSIFLESIHNTIPCAYGGSATYGGQNSQQDRAKKLVDFVKTNNIKLDILFIENGNDMNKINQDVDIDNDLPWFWKATYVYEGYTASSYSDAINYFRNNIELVLEGIEPSQGVKISLPYTGVSVAKVEVGSSANSEGTLILRVGQREYGITIANGMTSNQIVSKILEYSYEGYDDRRSSDGNSVDFYADSGDAEVSVVSNNSGASITVNNVQKVNYVNYSYKDLSIDNWLSANSWGESWSVESLTRCYKGLIEYINYELPETMIIWIGLPHYIYDFSNGDKRIDGSYDIDAYLAKSYNQNEEKLYELQTSICNRYRIPFINLSKNSNISLIKARMYYNNNDVHPKDIAYKEWGKILSNLLT